MEAIFVAEGQVVEEVFYGFDAAFGEVGCHALADALDEFDGRMEGKRHEVEDSSGGVVDIGNGVEDAWARGAVLG